MVVSIAISCAVDELRVHVDRSIWDEGIDA